MTSITPTVLIGLTLTSAGLFSLLVPWLGSVTVVGVLVLLVGVHRARRVR